MRRLFLILFSFLCAGSVFFLADIDFAWAQENKGMVRDVDNPANVSDATSYEGSFREAVLTIVNYFLYFVGLLGVVMVIYSGYLYIFSVGEDVDKGKKIIMYVAVGIILILISFALVNTILGAGDVNSGAQN